MDLTGAALYGVDLTGATLTGAVLTGATLKGVNVQDAELLGVKWPSTKEEHQGWYRRKPGGILRRSSTRSTGHPGEDGASQNGGSSE